MVLVFPRESEGGAGAATALLRSGRCIQGRTRQGEPPTNLRGLRLRAERVDSRGSRPHFRSRSHKRSVEQRGTESEQKVFSFFLSELSEVFASTVTLSRSLNAPANDVPERPGLAGDRGAAPSSLTRRAKCNELNWFPPLGIQNLEREAWKEESRGGNRGLREGRHTLAPRPTSA